MDPQFLPALRRIHNLFAVASRELHISINFALIGGLSMAAWGVVRATEDLDFLADCDPSPIGHRQLRSQLESFLRQESCQVEWRVGAHDDPIPLLLRIQLAAKHGGLGVDILWAHKRWQREALKRTVSLNVSRSRIRVLHPEDLILLKLDAGGPQDLADVEGLLADPPPQLNLARLKKTTARLRLGRLLEKCLRDISG